MKTCRLKIITANIIEETDSPEIHYVSQNKKQKNNSNIINNNENNNLIHNIEEKHVEKEILEKITEENVKISNEELSNNLQIKDNLQDNQIINNNNDINIDINDLCTISNHNICEEQKINNIYNNINNYNNNHLYNNYPYEIMNKKKVINNNLRCLFKNRITKYNNKTTASKSLSVSKTLKTMSGTVNKLNSKKNSKNNSKTNLLLNQSTNKSFAAKNKNKSSASLSSNKSPNNNNNKKNKNILRGSKKNGNIRDATTSIGGSGSKWKIVEKNDMSIGQIIDYKSLIDDLLKKECQLVKEKEEFIQIFENKLKPLREMNEKLINDNNEELDKEDELNGELILLKNQYDNLFNSLNIKDKNTFNKINHNKNKNIKELNISQLNYLMPKFLE